MKNIIRFISFFSITTLAFQTTILAEVNCRAYDSGTNQYVSGRCSSGQFNGYNSTTGSYVYGSCTPGGTVNAYDSTTSAYVYGNCDSESEK